MMRAETGSPIWKVIGSSMAMVAVAPMPGSTPIKVPRRTPMRQKSRFHSVEAVVKPRMRLSMSSILPSLLETEPRTEGAVRQVQTLAEDEIGEERHTGRQDERGERFHLHAGEGRREGGDEDGGHETHAPDRQAEENRRGKDQQHAAPGEGADGLALDARRLDEHDDAEQHQYAGEQQREIARPHA